MVSSYPSKKSFELELRTGDGRKSIPNMVLTKSSDKVFMQDRVPKKKRTLRPEVTEVTSKRDVFLYHDYRTFLNDEIKHQSKSFAGYSMRAIAREAKIAAGFLSMVLSGKKKLSADKLFDLARALSLNPREQNHLEYLRAFCDADSQQDKIEALSSLQRSIGYQTKNPAEHHVYRYLSRWFNVVIREMATKKGFQTDAKWIQSQLQFQVPLVDLKNALEFLISNKYIKVQPDGFVQASSENIRCMGGVYQVVLAQFHKEMFGLAIRSLDILASHERYLEGYTCSLSQRHFVEAQKIITEAIDKIEALEKIAHPSDNTGGLDENIYHFCFFAIPLLKITKKENS